MTSTSTMDELVLPDRPARPAQPIIGGPPRGSSNLAPSG